MKPSTENPSTIDANKITICPAELVHSKLIWEWRNDQKTRLMSRQIDLIPWEQHCDWFENSLVNPSRYLYIIKIDSNPFGVARFDLISSANNSFEISINLAPSYRGKGLGSLLLNHVLIRFNKDLPKDKLILAEIKRENNKSNLLFSKYGFNLTHQDLTMNQYSFYLKKNNL